MLGMGKRRKTGGGPFRFRVSDVVDVPLRGTILRLKLMEGTPSMGDLPVGARLRVAPADGGAEREVEIRAHSVTGGKASQERLDATRELDVVIAGDAARSPDPIEIGWVASGPA